MTTPTQEQIEAVARALARANDTPEIWWPVYKDKARAAIAAARPFIREQVLEEAARVVEEDIKSGCQCHECMRRYIDAKAIRSLKEKST